MNTQEYDIVTEDESKFKLITKSWGDTIYWYQNNDFVMVELHNPQFAVNTANTLITTSATIPSAINPPNYIDIHHEVINYPTSTVYLRLNRNGSIQIFSTTTGTKILQGVLIYPRADKIVTE